MFASKFSKLLAKSVVGSIAVLRPNGRGMLDFAWRCRKIELHATLGSEVKPEK